MLKTEPNMPGIKVPCAKALKQEEYGECEGTGKLVRLQIEKNILR